MIVGLLFAGQGGQTAGMGADLYQANDKYRQIVDQASTTMGIDFSAEQTAIDPVYAPVATAVMSYGIAQLVIDAVGRPAAIAGLSLGEYSALMASDSLAFDAGLSLIHDRAQYMNAAGEAQPGKMMAVISDQRELIRALVTQVEDVYVANYNAPSQLVVGGTVAGVDRLRQELRAHGIKKAIPLKVHVASHTPLMTSAATQLETRLASVTFETPTVPVYSNTTSAPFEVVSLKQTLVKQLTKATHFQQDLLEMAERGVDTFVEVGPGHALSSFAHQLLPAATSLNISDVESLQQVLEQLGGANDGR